MINKGDVLRIDCFVCTTARELVHKKPKTKLSRYPKIHFKIAVVLKKEFIAADEYKLKVLEVIDNLSLDLKLAVQTYKYNNNLKKFFKKSSTELLEQEIIKRM